MGLFGVSPQDILAQQQKADQELAMRQAQLAPGQGLMYQAASAGQRAGRSIAGLGQIGQTERLGIASNLASQQAALDALAVG
ncbi:MAG: hypothetical protein EBS19_10300, partial [Spirochaetia bacterium]|nr:hypothetical protein [Spirochaetia bacterium]